MMGPLEQGAHQNYSLRDLWHGTNEHYKHADMVHGNKGVRMVKKIGEHVSQFKVGNVVD